MDVGVAVPSECLPPFPDDNHDDHDDLVVLISAGSAERDRAKSRRLRQDRKNICHKLFLLNNIDLLSFFAKRSQLGE
jgi:hypothetical protein